MKTLFKQNYRVGTGVAVLATGEEFLALEKAVAATDPTKPNLTDGIELSDDPFPSQRSRVYALAVSYRQ